MYGSIHDDNVEYVALQIFNNTLPILQGGDYCGYHYSCHSCSREGCSWTWLSFGQGVCKSYCTRAEEACIKPYQPFQCAPMSNAAEVTVACGHYQNCGSCSSFNCVWNQAFGSGFCSSQCTAPGQCVYPGQSNQCVEPGDCSRHIDCTTCASSPQCVWTPFESGKHPHGGRCHTHCIHGGRADCVYFAQTYKCPVANSCSSNFNCGDCTSSKRGCVWNIEFWGRADQGHCSNTCTTPPCLFNGQEAMCPVHRHCSSHMDCSRYATFPPLQSCCQLAHGSTWVDVKINAAHDT